MGPSPRIRGKSEVHQVPRQLVGTIPANTGKIWLSRRRRSPSWDHPREYGENCEGDQISPLCMGPSPRIRGELTRVRCCVTRKGTIPANTGRIIPRPAHHQLQWDHPREYGENGVSREFTYGDRGSSPRIRGEFDQPLPGGNWSGIIPANTGRMYAQAEADGLARDHPREYGENYICPGLATFFAGSSPRIRGEFFPKPGFIFRIGIIPANTGRMYAQAEADGLARDHPREYGENDGTSMEREDTLGSSPRIRGESF